MPTFPDLALSVVIPAYNEEKNLPATMQRALAALRKHVGTFEILVVNDCSRDRTGELADEFARDNPEVRVLHNAQNLRQGGSLRRGFAEARLPLVTHNAMDYPFDFDDLPTLLRHFVPASTPGERPADVVVAARRTYPGTSRPRRFVSWVNRTLIHVLFGSTVTDYNFIQIYRREVLGFPAISDATSFITPEKIIRAHRKGLRVVEEVVDYHRREHGTPSSANVKNIRRALGDMGRLWWDLRGS
ncbi:MAG: glycosyltransferase family 2 protein [Myxococcales bacterium]|nr:glycosyltransferase family 2 protein [Myxococcales bacterium]